MRILPNTFTLDQRWESNPRPFDLESNALPTRPHAQNELFRNLSYIMHRFRVTGMKVKFLSWLNHSSTILF